MRDELEVLRRLQSAMGNAEVALARRMQVAPRDMTALTHVGFAADPVSPSDVGERIGVTRGAVTELLDRLERAGHVERSRDERDRRRVQLHITDAATAEVISHLQPLFADLDALFEAMPDDERAVVVAALERTVEVYERFSRPPDPRPAP